MNTSFPLDQRTYALRSLARYWPINAGRIAELQVFAQRVATGPLPPPLVAVALPRWSADAGVQGRILLPHHLLHPGESAPWTRADWLGAAYWYLNGCAERDHESRFGPTHSYAFRLRGWDERLWSHAWVNRIALFLRRWAARSAGVDENTLFGQLPNAEVLLTHDVDALKKTAAIRFKQAAFNSVNAVRAAARREGRTALAKIAAASRFLTSNSDYDCLDKVLDMEERDGIRSRFHFFAGRPDWRRLGARLFDPGYDIEDPAARAAVRKVRERGHEVGLHPSFNAWADADLLAYEKSRLERIAAAPVTTCRQHWLRFSWQSTWAAQSKAGFAMDTTLGFNDRPGFRNGAATRHAPLDDAGRELKLQAVPLILMDSHLYDYDLLDESARAEKVLHWVREIREVHGVGTVLWHPHTFATDYGWGSGFHVLTEALRGLQ